MHKYDLRLDLQSRNSLSIIATRVSEKSRVLEFGPGNGRLTRYLSEELMCGVSAVEFDETLCKLCAPFCEKIIRADIENYDSWSGEIEGQKFDFIIFADVLEHLYNPKKALHEATKFLSDNGKIIVSVPNISHNSIILELLSDKFNYRKLGILDDTHIRFFTKSSFNELIKEVGLYKSYETALFLDPANCEFDARYEDVPVEVAKYLQKRELGEAYQFVFEMSQRSDEVCEYDYLSSYKAAEYFYSQLYIDTGRGFCEEGSLICGINPQTAVLQSVEFEFDREVEVVRFDPVGDMCVLKIEYAAMKQSGAKLLLEQTNAIFRDGNLYYFATEDPQMVYRLPRDGENKKIVIEFTFLALGYEAARVVGDKISNERKENENRSAWKKIKKIAKRCAEVLQRL